MRWIGDNCLMRFRSEIDYSVLCTHTVFRTLNEVLTSLQARRIGKKDEYRRQKNHESDTLCQQEVAKGEDTSEDDQAGASTNAHSSILIQRWVLTISAIIAVTALTTIFSVLSAWVAGDSDLVNGSLKLIQRSRECHLRPGEESVSATEDEDFESADELVVDGDTATFEESGGDLDGRLERDGDGLVAGGTDVGPDTAGVSLIKAILLINVAEWVWPVVGREDEVSILVERENAVVGLEGEWAGGFDGKAVVQTLAALVEGNGAVLAVTIAALPGVEGVGLGCVGTHLAGEKTVEVLAGSLGVHQSHRVVDGGLLK